MNGEHGQLYEAITKMGDRLSDKIDGLAKELRKKDEDHDRRFGKLERFNSKVIGIAIGVSFIGGLLWRLVFS